jgi:hypothetical protein
MALKPRQRRRLIRAVMYGVFVTGFLVTIIVADWARIQR